MSGSLRGLCVLWDRAAITSAASEGSEKSQLYSPAQGALCQDL